MKQTCASATRLRGGGPILTHGSMTTSQIGSPPPRIVIGSEARLLDQACRNRVLSLPDYGADQADCRSLDNTEEILRFACLDQNVAKHRQALSLFEELSRAEGQAFASTCQRYTDLLANSIFEDRRCLSTLDCDPVTLSQFYEWEREIADLARQHGRILHQLEMKYTNPHCI